MCQHFLQKQKFGLRITKQEKHKCAKRKRKKNGSVLRLYIYHDENCNTGLGERQRGTLFIHNFTKKEGKSLLATTTQLAIQ